MKKYETPAVEKLDFDYVNVVVATGDMGNGRGCGRGGGNGDNGHNNGCKGTFLNTFNVNAGCNS